MSTVDTIFSGLGAGLANGILFNPIDRALYLQVKNNNKLFTKINWIDPYRGLSQTMYSKIIGYGIFFSLHDLYKNAGLSELNSSLLTGISTAIITNPITVIKMHNWNSIYNNKYFYRLLQDSKKQFGIKIFARGLYSIILRDSLFSIIFYLNPNDTIINNIIYGTTASVIISPINYVRNTLYFDMRKSKYIVLKETMNNIVYDIRKRNFNDLFFKKFNCGWYTLKVGLGMSFSRYIYDQLLSQNIESKIKKMK
jgi:hypothetical protein